jgi:GTP-binding protein
MCIRDSSKARPKIADYPFTTKTPNLGVVYLEENAHFVIVDIPGLIENAHQGAGLGIQFLKHIERTRAFIHLIDISNATASDAVHQYLVIRNELGSYNKELLRRPEIVAITKMDIPEVAAQKKEVLKELKKKTSNPIVFISAVAHQGTRELMSAAWKLLKE